VTLLDEGRAFIHLTIYRWIGGKIDAWFIRKDIQHIASGFCEQWCWAQMTALSLRLASSWVLLQQIQPEMQS
jgi:hypothetical protein